MQSWAKTILCVVTAVTLFLALCDPADARRRIRFGAIPSIGGGGYSEKIDKVYDLPDTGTYFNEGKYYDIGSFYQVSSGGGEIHGTKPVFVLYSGDRYIKLDDAQIALIAEELGFDPTANFRKEYEAKYKAPPASTSANTIERRDGESIEDFRARVRAMAGSNSGRSNASETPAATSRSSGGIGMGSILLTLLISAAVIWGALKFMRKRPAPGRSASGDEDDSRHMSFDERVAQRLREAREQGPGPAPVPATPMRTAAAPAPAMAPAGVRTFGRKAV